MPHSNLAARAGRWSAQHRKKAILGWLAFVVIAFVIGGAVGTTHAGRRGHGQRLLQDRRPGGRQRRLPDEASEQVLVQARNGQKRHRPGVQGRRRRRRTSASRRRRTSPRSSRPTPRATRARSPRTARSALVTFKVAGDDDVAKDRVDASLAATAAAQKAHPDLRVEQFGDASAGKALDEPFEKDFQRAETLSLPITLLILIVAFGALVAAGVPLLLGVTAVVGTIGLIAPISQIVPIDEATPRSCCSSASRSASTTRCSTSGARWRSATPGAPRGRARVRRGDLGPRGAHLRRHRDDRDGRHADRRQRGLHLDGRRHDPRRRGRRARLGDGAPRGAVQARRQGREGPRADHRQAPPRQPRRVARVGLDPRPGARAPGRLRRCSPAA